MARKISNHIKLGAFVVAGLGFLILLLYLIGKNQNMFGKTFVLKARFENVRGLMRGNNIRFGGIDAGTVASVDVINDTTIEVSLNVKSKLKQYIHNNARVSISTDGLMGNRLINILPAKEPAPLVQDGDVLFSIRRHDSDEMLDVLARTNEDIAFIAHQLRLTTQRINASKPLWAVLENERLPSDIRTSLQGFRQTSANLADATSKLNMIVSDIKNGKGTVGHLLMDSTIAVDIDEAIAKIKNVGVSADTVTARINALVNSVNQQINEGPGTVNALLADKEMKEYFAASVRNIEAGTKAFNDNMEAIKHNFLFRAYFRRLERQKAGQKPPVY